MFSFCGNLDKYLPQLLIVLGFLPFFSMGFCSSLLITVLLLEDMETCRNCAIQSDDNNRDVVAQVDNDAVE